MTLCSLRRSRSQPGYASAASRTSTRDAEARGLRVAAPAWPLLRRSRSCGAGLLAAHGLHIRLRLLERWLPSFPSRTSDDTLEALQKLSRQSIMIFLCWVSLAIGVLDVQHEVRDLLKPYALLLQKFLDFCKKDFILWTSFKFPEPNLVGSDENYVDLPRLFSGEVFDIILELLPGGLAEWFVHSVARAAVDDVIVVLLLWISIVQSLVPFLIEFDCQDPVRGLVLDDDLIDVLHHRVPDDVHAGRPLEVGRWL